MKANIKLCTILILCAGFLIERSDGTPEMEFDWAHKVPTKSWDSLPTPSTEICKTNETQELWRKVQVLCMVMTSKPYHRTRAEHVKRTWGSNCNNLIFISNETDFVLPSVVVGKKQKSESTPNLKPVFRYAYENFYEDVDWIVRADDDTFMVIENLRHFLSSYDPLRKLYMGYRVKGGNGSSYMLGTPGYVLSKESLKALAEEGFESKCKDYLRFGDAEIGDCLHKLGVEIVDTRDSAGRHRFLPYSPGLFMKPDALRRDDPVWKKSYYPIKTGFECCSKTLISTWTNLPEMLYLYQYMSHDIKLSVCQKKQPPPVVQQIVSTPPVNDSLYLELNLTFSNGVVVQKGRENIYLPPFLQEAVAQLKDEPAVAQGNVSKHRGGQSLSSTTPVQLVQRKLENSKNIQVLCMIMTSDIHHQSRVIHIKKSWGRKCSHLVFMSNNTDHLLSAMNMVKGLHSPYHPWLKTKAALQYVYDHYLNKIDWVLMIGDQGYVVYENMLSLLMEYNPSEKLFFGCRFKSDELKNGYMTVEAGSILSRGALKAFVENSLISDLCKKGDGNAEDTLLSVCLQKAGVKLVDTRDDLGRFRFLPLSVEYYLMSGAMSFQAFYWWFQRTYYHHEIGFRCCSSSIVALSHVASVNMYLYDFFLYQFKLMKYNSGKENEEMFTRAANGGWL